MFQAYLNVSYQCTLQVSFRFLCAGVSVDAQIGKSITTIRALDPDSPTPDAVRYNLSSIRGYRPKDNNEYLGDKPGLFFIGRFSIVKCIYMCVFGYFLSVILSLALPSVT